jgi:deoxyribonuclease V
VADDEVLGMAVRTRTGVTPVYVSVGHLITLDEAVDWTLRTTTRYRLPEPSRRAHRLAQVTARTLPTDAP